MYPHFITVHDNDNGEPFLVNIDHIVSIGKEGIILTGVPTAIALATVESFDELKQLVADAGCHIEKADPRLNTAKTADDGGAPADGRGACLEFEHPELGAGLRLLR